MPTTPGALPTALDSIWDALSQAHPDLPPARVAISTAPAPSDHGPDRWGLDAEGMLVGLAVGTDVLKSGPHATLTWLMHEAAHVLNWRRNIKDTASRGVYHSRAFLTTAGEVGLAWPDGQETLSGRGVAYPVLSDTSVAAWASRLASLAPAIDEMLPYLATPEPARTRPDRLTLVCGCDPVRRIRVAQSVHDLGPIMCGVCAEVFAAQR